MISSEARTYTMKLNWNDGGLAEGLRCFDRKEFFAAHEHWESVWLKCEEPQKLFLQALIQVASAFHHHQRGNPRGSASLLNRALQKLNTFPAHFEQIDIAELRATIARWLQDLETDPSRAFISYPQIPFIPPPREKKKAD